jgi:hypothetical protein
MYQQKKSDNLLPFAEDDGSVYTNQAPPDRNSSSSAPPALEISSESLFAFTLDYAKIFTDIRTHEDYNDFYETYGQKDKKLPPPLESHFLESLTLENEDESPVSEVKLRLNFFIKIDKAPTTICTSPDNDERTRTTNDGDTNSTQVIKRKIGNGRIILTITHSSWNF